MATIYMSVKDIELLAEPSHGGNMYTARVVGSWPAYSASSDSGKIGAGGYLFGVATTDTLATMIQKVRRDGKTVTLHSACTGEPGLQGTTRFFVDTLAVSSGSLTCELSDLSGTELDAASGVSDQPATVIVSYSVA